MPDKENDSLKLIQCLQCQALVRLEARFCRKCGALIQRNIDDKYVLGSRRYTFKYRHKKYRVDNAAFYGNAQKKAPYFEVRVCPECKKINPPDDVDCDRCGASLDEGTVRLAEKSNWKKWLVRIGIAAWYIVFSFILEEYGVWAVLISWLVWFALVMAFDKWVMNPLREKNKFDFVRTEIKIVNGIDNECLQRMRNSQPADEFFRLSRKCMECGAQTETDSVYCSNCGKEITDGKR